MTVIFTSTVLSTPIDQVWARIRDFNALPEWNPNVARSEIEDGLPSNAVGCVRSFYLQDGGHLRERLLSLSDEEFCFSYSILDSPMPVEGYVATVRLLPISDGDRTYAEWSAEFECPTEAEEELVEGIGKGVFLASFHALEGQLSSS